jgi:hypothetical protein
MANYKFQSVNSGAEMNNPNMSVMGVQDDYNGNCIVTVLLSIALAPQSNTAKFGVDLAGFTYVGDWTKTEIESWVALELPKYEV